MGLFFELGGDLEGRKRRGLACLWVQLGHDDGVGEMPVPVLSLPLVRSGLVNGHAPIHSQYGSQACSSVVSGSVPVAS